MALKKFKPTSPGKRFWVGIKGDDLSKKPPEKFLLAPLKKRAGRNFQGRITVRRRGGGVKRMYRKIDFRREKDGVPAKVVSIEYDPNRSCRIALLSYLDGEKRYILAPKDIRLGEVLLSGERVEPKVGNCMPLRNIPLGMPVHNIELQAGRGGQLVKSAGCVAQLSAKEGKHAHITLPSGEIRKILLDCRATIGQVGNFEHSNISIGKAGRNRWLGHRPKVRGTAQNPVSHPMGGGEGRSHGGRHPCSPTGKLSKGGKTRNPRSLSNKLIIQRRK